jgi:hypothetical protein
MSWRLSVPKGKCHNSNGNLAKAADLRIIGSHAVWATTASLNKPLMNTLHTIHDERNKWGTAENKAINLWVPQNAINSLRSWGGHWFPEDSLELSSSIYADPSSLPKCVTSVKVRSKDVSGFYETACRDPTESSYCPFYCHYHSGMPL